METIYLLAIVFWAPLLLVALRNLLWDTYFWQIKEYRFDRLSTHIRYEGEPGHRDRRFTYIKVTLFTLLAVLLFTQANDNTLLLVAFVIYAVLAAEAFIFLEQIVHRKFIRPRISLRNMLIVVMSVLLLTVPIIVITYPLFLSPLTGYQMLGAWPQTNVPIVNLTAITLFISLGALVSIAIDFASPIITTVAVILTYPSAWLKRYLLTETATNIVADLPGLKVVGITGTHGKTSTKELIYELVKDSFHTIKTPSSYNTDLGVAETVISSLTPETEIFVAEFGTYRRGEISKIAKVAQPDIAVVTNIGEAHIGIHGSKENLFAAKYELVESLKPNGVAVLNGDDEYCMKMAGKNKGNELLYFTTTRYKQLQGKSEPLLLDALVAQNVELKPTGIRFELKTTNWTVPIQTTIRDEAFLGNILAAIAVALELGIEIEDIKQRLAQIDLQYKRLDTLAGDNSTTIIDDTGNSNVAGFKAALHKLRSTQGNRKVVVTKGVYELGKYKSSYYQELAKEFGGVDLVITSDRILIKSIKHLPLQYVYAAKNDELIYQTRTHIQPGDTILMEGKLHPQIISTIRSDR